MARIGRRKLIKLAGVGAVAARTGGIAAILAAGRAPAYAQGTTLHWLRWSDFVPASDELLKKDIAPAIINMTGSISGGTSWLRQARNGATQKDAGGNTPPRHCAISSFIGP